MNKPVKKNVLVQDPELANSLAQSLSKIIGAEVVSKTDYDNVEIERQKLQKN